jgi:hypothetical protein
MLLAFVVRVPKADAYCLLDAWRLPLGEVDVFVHENMDDFGDRHLGLDVIAHQVRVAVRTWGERAPANVRLRFAGFTSDVEIDAAIVIQRESLGSDGQCASASLACIFANDHTDGRRDFRSGAGIWVDATKLYTLGIEEGRYSLQGVLVHELGHALGLAHPADCDEGRGGLTVMAPARSNEINAVPYRDDIEGVRAFNVAAGFLLEDMRYSSTGAADSWEREIEDLEAPELPLTVSRTTPTLATAGDRRVLAYPAFTGDRVRIRPGRGGDWFESREVTADDIGVTFSPVGVGIMDDDVLVVWDYDPRDDASKIYYAVSHDFGETFGTPRFLTRTDLTTGNAISFETVAHTGVDVTPDPDGQSWFLQMIDNDGQLSLSRVDRVSEDHTRVVAIQELRSLQRPQFVCGPSGDALNAPGPTQPVRCLGVMTNLDAFNTVTHVAATPFMGFPYEFSVAVETLLRTEQVPSVLWRPETAERPIWFGYTLHRSDDVFFFNHPRDVYGGWHLASRAPIPGQPLSSPGLGVTSTPAGNDVLQFVIGQVFP